MDSAEVQRIESKMLQYAREYTDDRASMRARVDRLSARTCYATRGKNMGFRGMYSPSLALKYLVGNATPGKLLKKQPPKLNGHYLYAFDERDRIIYAKQYPESNEPAWATFEEFIFYRGGEQISIVFIGQALVPRYVTLCEHQQELPILYAQLSLDTEIELFSLEIEQYEYAQQILSKIHWWRIWKKGSKYEGVRDVSKIRFDEQGGAIITDTIQSPISIPVSNQPSQIR